MVLLLMVGWCIDILVEILVSMEASVRSAR